MISEQSKERARAKRLLDCFKLTPEKWQKVDDFQKNVCYVCGQPQKSGNRLSTDHDHKTGLYRGHLCVFCNKIFGLIDRFWTVDMIGRAFEYLKNPPATQALGEVHYGWPGRVTTKKHRKMLKRLKKEQAKNLQTANQ